MFDFVGGDLIKTLFCDVNYDVKSGLLDIKKVKLVIEKLLQEIIFFPIECIFLFGSSVNGNFKPYSDIDVIVIVDGDDYWHKITRIYDGYLFDIRVFDIKTLNNLEVFAHQTGFNLGVSGIAEGVCIFDKDNRSTEIKEKFLAILNDGTDKVTDEILIKLRRSITNSLIELITLDENDYSIILAVGFSLYEDLGFLLLASRKMWLEKGKWAIRHLQEEDPEIAFEYLKSFKDLANGERVPLCAFAIKILENCGGVLWEKTLSHPAPKINRADV